MARRMRNSAAALLALVAILAATPVAADEYDSEEAGHPLRMAAYILHPFGVIIDWLIFRPAHWVVSHEGMGEFFGHDNRDD